ncbi:hypothetical protein TNCV_4000921 [Trichonephila clavipes]|nr:hypothetical protein TNCV_4000921 [Trichonephila clavipes]
MYYREGCLLFRYVDTRIGWNPTIVTITLNRLVQEGYIDCALQDLNRPHMDLESGSELVCSTTSIRTDSAMTSVAVRTVFMATIITAFIEGVT